MNLRKDHCTHRVAANPLANPVIVPLGRCKGPSRPANPSGAPRLGQPNQPIAQCINTFDVTEYYDGWQIDTGFSLEPVELWPSKEKTRTTLSNGYLGSCNDEERSEMRYVV